MADQTKEEILTHEQNLTQATQRLDIDALDYLYADDILFTGANGSVCDKSSVMNEARRGVEEAKKAPTGSTVTYEKTDIQTAVHGNTAVTSYQFTVNFQFPGKAAINNRFRTTNVWMKRPEGWQVVAAHTSKLE